MDNFIKMLIERLMTTRKKYPCEEVCPEDFLSNAEVERLLSDKDNFKFEQDDYKKLLNCVQCNECDTSEERILLVEKFLEDGNILHDNEMMLENFKKFNVPFPTNKYRIKNYPKIPESSDTLFFMGCLSTIRIPKFTNHAIEYLLSKNIDFTILKEEVCCGYPILASGVREEFNRLKDLNIKIFRKYKKIICLCPACYFIFNQYYPKINGVEFVYIAEYLEPSASEKKGSVGVQHLCQLINRGYAGFEVKVDKILSDSGYKVQEIPHWCCGGGIGYVHRTDIIDKIASKRMKDFTGDYYTTYCSGCYWTLRHYKNKLPNKKKTKLKDIFELLM